MDRYDVVIIGAGASGLVAAIRAGELGCSVALVEKNNKPGVKLAITGKGRCNITNTASASEFYKHIHPRPRFLKHAFHRFFSRQIIQMLSDLGVSTTEERGGRVFPTNGKASDIVQAFMRKLQQLPVTILYGARVDALLTRENQVTGVQISRKGQKENIQANHVILSSGGQSYPATGSTGEGYELARSVGHRITPARQALVPLETREAIPRSAVDLVLKNVTASVWSDGKKQQEAFGELFFTDYGLSGSIILTLSGFVVDELRLGKNVRVSLDLKPALDEKKLDNRLLRDLEQFSKKQTVNLFRKWMPADLIPVFVEQTGIDPKKPAHQITARERRQLKKLLKGLTYTIKGPRSFKEAIITAGGIPTDEIHSRTLESKLVSNLYFAGEVIDLHGDTGGYNLQIAFSTGWLAAESCADQGQCAGQAQ